MKNLIKLSAVAAMVIASPAFAAASDSDSFTVNANIATACVMENIQNVTLDPVNIDTNSGSGALLLASDTSNNSNKFWVSCNQNNQMTIAGSPVLQGSRALQSGDDATFTDKLNYRVTAENYYQTGTQPSFGSVAGATANQGTTRGAIHRQVQMKAEVRQADNAGKRPLAGTYSGTVTVTVSAV
ncbi:spore coat protein U domain-containing protein [Sphingomonas cavernae]|uniref:Spore coat protein U/FanG domain-containing protein n=1 Tax=Sphingomonas cavernae TaxID=2320861 RepID=A0A418WQ75_9SPHN|nr:spore coat protein U domain-containing protein [Sphingomonas cavernae]RJF93376.1 hypothetical protein D3876_03270 [Sphingomonas cavernae]